MSVLGFFSWCWIVDIGSLDSKVRHLLQVHVLGVDHVEVLYTCIYKIYCSDFLSYKRIETGKFNYFLFADRLS